MLHMSLDEVVCSEIINGASQYLNTVSKTFSNFFWKLRNLFLLCVLLLVHFMVCYHVCNWNGFVCFLAPEYIDCVVPYLIIIICYFPHSWF